VQTAFVGLRLRPRSCPQYYGDMSWIAAGHQWMKPGVWLLLLTLSSAGQNTKPDFTGFWRSVPAMGSPVASSIIEIRQTDSTVALRPVIPNQPPTSWSVYSTDGSVLKTKMGRHIVERTGHWQAGQLILRETSPGNAPWRRSTEQRTLSLSSPGGRMTIKVHNLSDTKSLHDYAIESERVEP
jgi:hypothetical protein